MSIYKKIDGRTILYALVCWLNVIGSAWFASWGIEMAGFAGFMVFMHGCLFVIMWLVVFALCVERVAKQVYK